MCIRDRIDNEQTPSLEEDLVNLPSESKGEGVKRFFQSPTVTTCANETNTSVQSQVHVSQTPVLTTTSTPKTTTCGLSLSLSLIILFTNIQNKNIYTYIKVQ